MATSPVRARTAKTASHQSKTRRAAKAAPGDVLLKQRIRHACAALVEAGILTGSKDRRVTVRLQDQLLAAAKQRTGIQGEAALVTAGLALLAAQDDFGAWLVTQRGQLSDDFDLGL